MREAPGPSRPRPAAVVDPDLVEAARILRGALVRAHPSFRFEERLAASLHGRARASVLGSSTGTAPRHLDAPIAFPVAAYELTTDRPSVAAGQPARLPGVAFPAHVAVRVPRGVLIGGAIASGVSLAGAALLARRWRARPTQGVFARAVRAAHRGAAGRRGVARGGVA